MAHYDSAPAMGGDYVPLRPSGGPDVELLDNDEDFPGGDPLNAWRATPHHPGASTGWSASALWRSLWPHNGAVSPQGRGWQRPQLSVLEVLLAVITALLAAAVLLLSSDVRVSKALAAAQLRHWEGISPAAPQPPTSPPAKPPPPSPPASSATAPVSAWVAHLQAAGYVPYVSSFVTLWVDSAHADLLLQFPHSAHNRLILLNAEVSAADADTYLLHQPLGEAFWHVSPAPDGGLSLDVVVPPLERQRVAANSTLAPAAAGGGVYAGPAYTLRRYSGGEALGLSSALDAETGQKSAFYLANDFLLNRFALVDVPRELDTASLDGARLGRVTAHPRNLELDVQGGANGTHVAVHLSLTLAPDVPMAPRLADDRAGFFSSCFVQLGSDPTSSPGNGDLPRSAQDRRACLAHRWRLERAAGSAPDCGLTPASPKCIPKAPITYHLDPSIPDKWAACFAHGVTAWDAAFTAAGWAPGTIRALRPSDAAWPSDYSAQDIRFSSITFAPSLSSVYAVGPSVVDPRSGEVIAADIMFAHSWVSWFLGEWHSLLAGDDGPANASASRGGDYLRVFREPRPSAQCFHHHGPAQHGGSGAGALVKAHGLASPGLTTALKVVPFAAVPATSAEAFICEGLADVTAHEVGHTLGLRHNFAGSAAYSAAQLNDPAFLASHGVTASVMDYVPPLMWANRSAQSYYFGPVVGEYDKWAISVGYAPSPTEEAAWHQQQQRAGLSPTDDASNLEPASPEVVPPEVAALLARANETALQFCTDDSDSSWSGNDPSCSTYDLTSDPVSYFRDRNALIAAAKTELVARLVAPSGEWSDAYDLLHTLLHTGSISVATGGQYAAKQVGGAVVRSAHYRQVAAPVAPVAAATQRDALQLIVDLLVGDALYPDPATGAAMTRNAAVWRGRVSPQKDSLGRLPADILGDARAAKASILASLLAPSRADGVVRNAWMQAGTAGGNSGVVTLLEVVAILQRGIWGDGLLVAVNQSRVSMVIGGTCPNTGDPTWLAAAASMGQHDGERRAVQRMWVDALRQAADASSSAGAACDLCAVAAASLAELMAGLRCALSFVTVYDDWAPGLRAHLLALTSA